MPYFRGEELVDVYANAKMGGYGFVASNITHLDIMSGLIDGAAAADSDVVLQVKRDVDTEALIDALESDAIGGAALD